MLKEYDQGFKIIIAGSSGVGKSCLLLRFVDNVFRVDFKFKTMDIHGTTVKMQIWDTAGSQNFRSIVSAYYRGANAVVLVYRIGDKLSFHQLTEFWMQEVNKYKQPGCEIMLLANMMDIVDDRVEEQEVRGFMESNGITIFSQTSAKTGENVYEAFKQLGERLLQKNRIIRDSAKKKEAGMMVKLDVEDPKQEQRRRKRKRCCK